MRLVNILVTLSPKEFRYFLKVVESPAFNAHAEVMALGKLLESQFPQFETGDALKASMHHFLYGDKSYDDLRIRHLVSLLVELAELSLGLPTWRESMEKELWTAGEYARRGLAKEHATSIRKAKKKLSREAEEGVSTLYHYHRYQIGVQEQLGIDQSQRAIDTSTPFEDLDQFFAISKLRQACIKMSRQRLDHPVSPSPLLEEIKVFLNGQKDVSPLARLYSGAIKTMESASDMEAFQGFTDSLQALQDQLEHETGVELHILARNFCIRKMNAGDEEFAKRLYDLYRLALTGKFVHDAQGYILPSAFKNIVSTGIKLSDFLGVEAFLQKHSPELEEKYRSDYLLFSQGRLKFAEGKFEEVVSILRTARYSNAFLELDCRILLCKAWYELGEIEVCFSLVESTTRLLKRRNLQSYHRESYLLILWLVRALIQWPLKGQRQAENLKKALEREDLPDRTWFREKVEQLILEGQ